MNSHALFVIFEKAAKFERVNTNCAFANKLDWTSHNRKMRIWSDTQPYSKRNFFVDLNKHNASQCICTVWLMMLSLT